MVDGVLGQYSEIWLTDAADALTKLNGVKGISPPSLSVSKIDDTDLDSEMMEFIASMPDPGEISFKIKYIPGGADDLLVAEHLISREKRAFKIVSNGSAAQRQKTGIALVLTYKPDELAPNQTQMATVTMAVSGATTDAAAA